MTQEEKAKAYDEALKRAKDILSYKEVRQEDMEYLFPELAESEDEKIRKAIVEFFVLQDDNTTYSFVPKKDILAWLEKQGKDKVSVVDFKAKDWYVSKVDGKIYNAKFMEKTSTNQTRKLEIEKAAMSATGIIKQEEWFIKGAEWADENPSYISSEKQSEQNPPDKFEPKFHEGDWIVREGVGVYKVIEVCESRYEVVDDKDKHYSIDFYEENMCHLWTIKDAKDGDVLVDVYGNIGIFEKHDDFDWTSYCSLGVRGGFQSFKVEHENGNACPATNAQRDLLFQKMYEVGYTFDFKKKELKKLKFRVGDYIRNKKTSDKVIIEQLDIAAKAYCYVSYDGAAVNHSDFPFAKQDEWELVEQKVAENSAKVSESSIEEKDMTEYKKGFECGKQRVLKYPEDFGLCKKPADTAKRIVNVSPDWSEEDEEMLDGIILRCEKYGHQEQINWLKSLKQRIGE